MKIGVILPLGTDGASLTYPDLREQALTAEAVGLDSVWIYDHLLYHFPGKEPQGVWEATTVWAGLAEATKRVELGALVLCTAFRNPAVLAKLAITLDHMSNHRIILGLGAGWHEPEFNAFGLPFTRLVDQFEEACKIIVPLVKEGRVDFSGEYVSAPNCLMAPPPSRPGGIPVLIAAFKPRMLQLTARYADAYNTAWHGDVSDIATNREAMAEACRAEGRDPGSMTFTAGVNVHFGDPEAKMTPEKWLTGSVEEIGSKLRAYRDAGVDHVIAMVDPLTPETIRQLGSAAALAR